MEFHTGKVKCKGCGLVQDDYEVKEMKAKEGFVSQSLEVVGKKVTKCINCGSGNLKEYIKKVSGYQLVYEAI